MIKLKKNIFLENGIIIKKIIKDDIFHRNYLKKEYLNFLKVKENKTFVIPTIISFNFDSGVLKTKYISGINLKNIKNPKIFRDFGKKLKLFHDEGFVHSELEVQDVIYLKDNNFALVDFHHLNEKIGYLDYARFIISLNILKIKFFWNWYFYNNCIENFILGYNLDKKIAKKYIILELNSIILYYKKGNFISKLKGFILDIVFCKLNIMKLK